MIAKQFVAAALGMGLGLLLVLINWQRIRAFQRPKEFAPLPFLILGAVGFIWFVFSFFFQATPIGDVADILFVLVAGAGLTVLLVLLVVSQPNAPAAIPKVEIQTPQPTTPPPATGPSVEQRIEELLKENKNA